MSKQDNYTPYVLDTKNPDKPPDENAIEEISEAMRVVMNTPEGRMVVGQVMAWADIYGDVFAGNSLDIYTKGRRSIGIGLMALMNSVDPTMYPRLLLELANSEVKETNKTAKTGKNK